MGFFDELEEEHKKDGMFTETDVGVSYPIGFPIIDQQLGFRQEIKLPDGSITTQTRLGVPAGTVTMMVGPSSSGKSTGCCQMAYNLIAPYGEDSTMLIFDAEEAWEPQRVMDINGIDRYEYKQRFRLINDLELMTFENTLATIYDICMKKESDKERYTYNTGFKNIHGEDIIYYLPTSILIDSLMKIVPKEVNDEINQMDAATIAMRIAIRRGNWLSKLVGLARKYNINIFLVNHLGSDIPMPGASKGKQLTFIPTGKNVPGGEKVLYYTTSLLVNIPVNSKDGIKTEEESGYNGLPIRLTVAKSRSGPGGKSALIEFVQESGFDLRLTLMNFAKENGLIAGRNPSSYFIDNPDVKFDTRQFVKEITENPEILKALYKACKPLLNDLVRDAIDEDDPIHGRNAKKSARALYLEMMED